MSTIYQRKDGKWLWVGYEKVPGGKPKRPNRTFNTEEEAKEYDESLKKSFVDESHNLTVQQYYDMWTKNYWGNENRYSFSTTSRWEPLFKKHILPIIGNDKIDNINIKEMSKYLSPLNGKTTNASGLSRKTKQNIVSALSSMLNDAYMDFVIPKKPDTKHIRITGDTREEQISNILPYSDYVHLVDYINEINTKGTYYYIYLIEFLFETGLRFEECSAITLDDIKEDNMLYVWHAIKQAQDEHYRYKPTDSSILKSSMSHREVPLTDRALEMIQAQEEQKKKLGIKSKYIFCSMEGNTLTAANVRRSFHGYIDLYNKNHEDQIKRVGLHSLRKLCCKRIVDCTEDGDLYLAQRLLGHSSVLVTNKYYLAYDKEEKDKVRQEMNRTSRSYKREAMKRAIEGADDMGIDNIDEYVKEIY